MALEFAVNIALAEPALHRSAARSGGGSTPEAGALRAMLTGGLSALSPEQRQAMQARQNPDIRAAMSISIGNFFRSKNSLDFIES